MKVLLALLLVAGYEERWTMSFCQRVALVIAGIMIHAAGMSLCHVTITSKAPFALIETGRARSR